MLPQFFARRYLFSPKSRSVVNLISGLSVVAVSMPVAAMIILLSVFNGFESLVKSMYSAFDADLTVSARLGQTFPADAIDTAAVARIPGVEAFSFVLEQSALLEHAGRQATARCGVSTMRMPRCFRSTVSFQRVNTGCAWGILNDSSWGSR